MKAKSLLIASLFLVHAWPVFGEDPKEEDVDELLNSFSSLPKAEQTTPSLDEPDLQVHGSVVLGVPIGAMSSDWNSARLLTEKDFSDPSTTRTLHVMKEYGWEFALTADVDSDGVAESAGVGIFEKANGDRGTFVIVADTDGVELLSQTSDRVGFGAVRFDERGLVYAGCMECDDVRFFTFDEAQEKAACVVPRGKIDSLLEAQRAFVTNPSRVTAEEFLERLPPDFCRYNAAYGYDELYGSSPLAGESLWELFPKLEVHARADKLLKRYVAYAVTAYWSADNVSAMQRSYRDMALKHPALFVETMSDYSLESRKNAYRFLFDGPHPSNHRAYAESLEDKICDLDTRGCAELISVWTSMRDHAHY